MDGVKLVQVVDFVLVLANALQFFNPWKNITSVCFKSHLPFIGQNIH